MNSLLPLGAGQGILWGMTSTAARSQATHRVASFAMCRMMSMMMMPMMHRQPSL